MGVAGGRKHQPRCHAERGCVFRPLDCRMPTSASPVIGSAQSASPAPGRNVRSLSGLWPFLRPYRVHMAAAVVFLVLAAGATLVFPIALKSLIDQGLVSSDPGERVMALREHFFALFAVGAALGLFSAARFYAVTWLGERVTADLRNAVYAHVVKQSPEFFETTQTGEVLSRLTTDTTLVQTVVGSSLSMGLRNTVMGIGAMVMLIITNPYVMSQVLGILVLVVLPSLYFGRRVRKLSRASQDRVADSSAIAAEVLNAIPVVQSYTPGRARGRALRHVDRERLRHRHQPHARALGAGRLHHHRHLRRAAVGPVPGHAGGDRAATSAAGHLGQTVVFVIILVSSVAVLSEVYGDLLRAAGATERLMELLAARSPIESPAQPVALPATRAGSSLELRDVSFHYPSRPQHPSLQQVSLQVQPGRDRGAGRTVRAPARPRCSSCCCASTTRSEGRSASTACPCATTSLRRAAPRIGLVPQDRVIFSAARWRTSATASPRRATTR